MKRRQVKKIKVILWLCLGALVVLSYLPTIYHVLIGALVGIWLLIQFALRVVLRSAKHTDSRGYTVLTRTNELEHRHIAKLILGRNLEANEVVHHINGRKTDNEIENLCLMDREKHEHFHAWLVWKKKKSGRYPPIPDQKRILESDYDGVLLETLSHRKNELAQTSEHQQKDVQDLDQSESQNTMKNLIFEELKVLRKKIADERNIPIYMIFENRTLSELSEEMPESELEMLEIWGVGPVKMKMYGGHFLKVISQIKHKNSYATSSRPKRKFN